MLSIAVVLSLCAVVYTVPAPKIGSGGGWRQENPADDSFLGIAWDAAASVVNQYRNGRFMVPKKVLEAKTLRGSSRDGLKTDMIVLFQESWCSPQDGNSLADICESMCPLFYGGAEAKYRIINYQNFHGENTVHATKLEDVKPRRTRNIELDQ
ncbi:hypothetical protein Aduo_016551 [Ancylostoma duodenale]